MLTSYFSSIYFCGTINDDVNDLGLPFLNLPNNVHFTVDNVFYGLSTIRGVNSVDPYGLSRKFLYQLHSIRAYPLFSLFRRSLDEGIIPSILKLSSVTFIHISGNNSDITNYRLISVQFH